MTAIDELRPSRSDRAALYVTIAFLGAALVGIAWTTAARLGEVLGGDGIPVLVPFMDETAPLPIGPNGSAVEVAVDRAIVTVHDPAPATFFALVAQPIALGLTLAIGVVLLAWFCVNITNGRAFTRTNVRVVTGGTATLLAGWVVNGLFTTMGVNGTLAAVSERTYEGVLFQTDFTLAFTFLAFGAIATAFQIGERLQRDTEGLV